MKKIMVAIICAIAILSCTNDNLTKEDNSFIITSTNKYYIHYQGMYIEMTPETYITRNKQLKDYLTSGFLFIKNPFSNTDLINDLNKYFSYEIKGVAKEDYTGDSVEMPVIDVNEKKVIDTVNLTKILEENSIKEVKVESSSDIVGNKEEKEEINLEGIKINILNANGINGIAKKTGDKLKEALKIEYNAENYSKEEDNTYILSSLNINETQEIVDTLNIRNIKLSDIKPENYSVEIILGKDATKNNTIKYNVELISKADNSELKILLKDYSLNTKKELTDNFKIDDNMVNIYYNKEDYFIAKRLNNLIPKSRMIENNEIRNKVVITTDK